MTFFGNWKRTTLNATGTLAAEVLVRAHLRSLAHAVACQERLFRNLRDRLAGTVAGKESRLERHATHLDFIRNVPPQTYDHYADYVKRIMEGEPHVLYPDRTEFFLVTSGTSGFNSKMIPCNTAQRKLIEQCQRRALAFLIRQSQGLTLTSDRFAYGTRAGRETINGIPKDYMSGIVPQLIPRPLRTYVVPSVETLQEQDWIRKVKRIANDTRHRDVRGIFGVPAHLLHVLRAVAAEWGVNSLREVWPHLETCVYSGTSAQAFRHSINRLAGTSLSFFGAYVATEGPLGFELPGPATDPARMAFLPDLVLYSFRDVNQTNAPLLSLSELRAGGEYQVHMGTPNGILHYDIRDWIKVARTHPFVQFELMGRIDAVLNAATEKTSEAQISSAIHLLHEHLGIRVADFFVHAAEDEVGTPRYVWTLALDEPIPLPDLVTSIDNALMETSGDYREARLETHALAAPSVRLVPPNALREHFQRRIHHPGQYKMRHAFRSPEDFCAYCTEQGITDLELAPTPQPEPPPWD